MLRPHGGHLDRGGRHAELQVLALRRGAHHQEGSRQGESVRKKMIKFHSEGSIMIRAYRRKYDLLCLKVCHIKENLLHYLKICSLKLNLETLVS